ncbi:MAG: TonB family protein [Sulfitobacter sp.]|jgi:protein TonB
MKQVLEFSMFLAVATASHFALFQGDQTGAAEAMGNEGAEVLTLTASSESLSAMVQEWDRPVEAVQQVAMPEQAVATIPPVPTLRPSQPEMQVPRLATPDFSDPLPETSDLPTIDTADPPRPNFAAVQSARPNLRPPAPPRKVAKPAAKKQSISTKRQVAAGAGKGKAAGKKKEAKAPAKRQASSPAAMSRWGGSIRSAIERRKKYPANTRARGRVMLAVAVSSNGSLASVRIKRSSGNGALDRAAVAAVKRARFKAAPKGVKSGVHHFSLPISFSR